MAHAVIKKKWDQAGGNVNGTGGAMSTVNGTRLVQSLSLDELIILDGSDGCTPEVVSSIPVGANFGSVDFPCWFQDRTCLRLGGVELRLVVG